MDTGKGFRELRPKTCPGVLQLLFASCVLTVFHNADEVLGFFPYPKWILKDLVFHAVDPGPPCFVIRNIFWLLWLT